MKKKAVIIFASGKGSNAKKIIERLNGSDLAEVSLVVSNKEDADVLEMASDRGIETLLIRKSDLDQPDFIHRISNYDPSLIVLAGFLLKIPAEFVRAFPDLIVNIHPSLLPKYGGKGMYGKFVHEAVFNAGEEESGITVHWVNENYDEGEIIKQVKCDIKGVESSEEIAKRVQGLEHKHFPEIILNLLYG